MTRPRPAPLVALGAAALLVVVALVVWRVADSGGRSEPEGRGVVRDLRAASAPFASLTTGTILVGRKPLRVVVADSLDERVQGLRGRAGAAPYDGMLFVFPTETTSTFTMASVRAPLDISFYRADGSVADRLRMAPCPGTDATCPVYRARAPFQYALETARGAAPSGPLAVR